MKYTQDAFVLTHAFKLADAFLRLGFVIPCVDRVEVNGFQLTEMTVRGSNEQDAPEGRVTVFEEDIGARKAGTWYIAGAHPVFTSAIHRAAKMFGIEGGIR